MQHIGTQTIETERLYLRPFRASDAPAMFRNWASDSAVTQYVTWKTHETAQETAAITAAWEKQAAEDPRVYQWAIELKSLGEPIGSISAMHVNESVESAELGWCIGRQWWGRGIMPEAARRVLRHAFEDLGLTRVWCCFYEGNEKSKRVQQKLGFRYVRTDENVPVPLLGEVRTDHVNLMTKADWAELSRANISYVAANARFNYRVCGILLSEGRILAMHDERSPYYYLPGGRVKLGEIAEDAVLREIREELGVSARILRPLWLNQAFFTEEVDGLRYHELCLYFLLDASGTDLAERGEGFTVAERQHSLRFEWLAFDRLKDEYFYPNFLKTEIFSLPEHLVLRTEIE